MGAPAEPQQQQLPPQREIIIVQPPDPHGQDVTRPDGAPQPDMTMTVVIGLVIAAAAAEIGRRLVRYGIRFLRR